MRCLAIIPARGGSVRIPMKNIRLFKGKPMLAYPIEQAIKSELFEEIVVSTDSDVIAEVAMAHGATSIHRRAECDGTMGTQEVAAMVLEKFDGFDFACVIYATSPLLASSDLLRGFRHINRFGTLFSMAVCSEPLSDAGCFYWGLPRAFREYEPLIGPETRMVPLSPHRVCDINTEEDWLRAESMYDILKAVP